MKSLNFQKFKSAARIGSNLQCEWKTIQTEERHCQSFAVLQQEPDFKRQLTYRQNIH